MTDPKKVIGKVIKVSKDGWGFISSREIQFTRIFFHWTSLRQDTLSFPDLKTGMTVEFTPLQIEGKGWRAMHVRVIEKTPLHKEVTNEDATTPAVESDSLPILSE